MSDSNTETDLIRFYALIAIGVVAALIGWCCLYIMPTDNANLYVMKCQSELGDLSQESYELCEKQYRCLNQRCTP